VCTRTTIWRHPLLFTEYILEVCVTLHVLLVCAAAWHGQDSRDKHLARSTTNANTYVTVRSAAPGYGRFAHPRRYTLIIFILSPITFATSVVCIFSRDFLSCPLRYGASSLHLAITVLHPSKPSVECYFFFVWQCITPLPSSIYAFITGPLLPFQPAFLLRLLPFIPRFQSFFITTLRTAPFLLPCFCFCV